MSQSSPGTISEALRQDEGQETLLLVASAESSLAVRSIRIILKAKKQIINTSRIEGQKKGRETQNKQGNIYVFQNKQVDIRSH